MRLSRGKKSGRSALKTCHVAARIAPFYSVVYIRLTRSTARIAASDSLCPAKVVIFEGQGTNPLARGSEDRIAHRRRNPSDYFLADPGNRVIGCADPMDTDLRHLCRAQQGVIVKVALNDSPFFDRDFLTKSSGQSHGNLHLHLPFGGQGVNQERAGVHGNVNPFHTDRAFLADRNGGHRSANGELFTTEPAAIANRNSHSSP